MWAAEGQVHQLNQSGCTEQQGNSDKPETSAACVSYWTQTLPPSLAHHKHTLTYLSRHGSYPHLSILPGWFHRGSDLCLQGLAGCHWSIPAVWTEEDTPSPATDTRTAPVSMCGETAAECSLAHSCSLAPVSLVQSNIQYFKNGQ